MVLAGVAFFALLAADVHAGGRLKQMDPEIARRVFQVVGPSGILIFSAISGMGELKIIAPLAVIVGIWLIARKDWRGLAGWAAALLGSAVLCGTLKNIFLVPRPSHFTTYTFDQSPGYSFPSGHTMTVAIFAGALVMVIMHAFALRRATRFWMCGIAAGLGILEAFALLMVGVHFLTDVLGGLAISLAWLGLIRLILPPRLPLENDAKEVHGEIDRGTNTGPL